MRLLAALLFFGATHLASQVAPSVSPAGGDHHYKRPAKVEGKVVNSASGEPVARVTLSLGTDDPTQPPKYTAKSDMQGSFLFDHVEPGHYRLHGEKPGFIGQDYRAKESSSSGTPLTLSEGQHVKELLFKLTPQGVISGKVTDDAGEPMDKVSVAAMQWGYWQGRRLLRPIGGAQTDDRGEYRIANLTPGNYYLAANRGSVMAGVLRFVSGHAPSVAAPETPEEDYSTTYYPGSSDPLGAAPVQVVAGSELSGVDIQALKIRAFRVSGQVIDSATGQPATEAEVALFPPTTGGIVSLGSLGGPRIPGGKFEITSVFPGPHVLMVQVNRKSQTLYARQSVYVVDRDLTDVVIKLPQAVDVVGRLRVSGEDLQTQRQQHTFRMDSVRIVLSPAEGLGLGRSPETTPQADGSFVLRDVVPDKFRVQVWGTPPRWYLKSILVGQQETSDGIVDLAGGGAIEVMVAMGAGEVTGSVVDVDDKPAPGVEVALVPEDAGKEGRADLFRITTSDQEGRFQFQDVVPGRYKILAWQEVEPAVVQDPEFRRLFESEATSVRLNEGGRETVQLKAISAEDVARALGNRP